MPLRSPFVSLTCSFHMHVIVVIQFKCICFNFCCLDYYLYNFCLFNFSLYYKFKLFITYTIFTCISNSLYDLVLVWLIACINSLVKLITLLLKLDFIYSFSNAFIHKAAEASLGMRKSPLGETDTLPTFGPSGRQDRLNCCVKNLR